ncbi:MAG: DUF1580 domain-containing protein [Thermoguttaceae bacterium]|jgi:hypothetical protein
MLDKTHSDSVDDAAPNINRLFRETIISFAQAARLLPALRGTKSPAPSTIYRWATDGRRSRSHKRILLEKCRLGGTNCTSVEALIRFFQRLDDKEDDSSAAGVPGPDSPNSPGFFTITDILLQKQYQKAKRILFERGYVDSDLPGTTVVGEGDSKSHTVDTPSDIYSISNEREQT